MASLARQTAEAIRVALAGASFKLAFEPARDYVPEFDVSALADLRVTVIPRTRDEEDYTRAKICHKIEIDVAVQQHLDHLDLDLKDALADLAEEIGDFLRRRPLALAGGATAVQAGPIRQILAVPEHLREKRVFTSVLTVPYDVAN